MVLFWKEFVTGTMLVRLFGVGRVVGDDPERCRSPLVLFLCLRIDVAKRKTSSPPEPNSRRLIGGNRKDDVPMVILRGSTE